MSDGFSLTVTLLNDSGKDVRTDEYYRGCKLVLRARSLKRFTGLYVAGVSAEGLWEGFDVSLSGEGMMEDAGAEEREGLGGVLPLASALFRYRHARASPETAGAI